jgi:hypothetical protein
MEEKNKNANVGAKNEPTGAKNKTQTFDEVLSNKEYQAEFDRRVQKAIETAKGKWQEINDAQKTEAEKLAKMNKEQKLEYKAQKEKQEKEKLLAELNAYKMKEEAIKIASEKGLEVSLLNLIDFRTVTIENLNENIDNLATTFNKAVEKAVNERLKKDTPITKFILMEKYNGN